MMIIHTGLCGERSTLSTAVQLVLQNLLVLLVLLDDHCAAICAERNEVSKFLAVHQILLICGFNGSANVFA